MKLATIFAVSVLISAAVAQTPEDSDVSVIYVEGAWKSGATPVVGPPKNPAGRVSRQKTLSAEASPGSATAEIILMCDEDQYTSYSCSKCSFAPCGATGNGITTRQFELRKSTRKVTQTGIREMVASLWHRKAAPIAAAQVVARAEGSPNDAVVMKQESNVHLGPALRRMVEGRYCFELVRLPAEGPTLHFTLEWDRSVDAEGVVELPDVTPGIYELKKGASKDNGVCSLDELGIAAWLAVVPASDFEGADAEWREHLSWIADLEKAGSSPGLVMTMTRARLSSIADGVEQQ